MVKLVYAAPAASRSGPTGVPIAYSGAPGAYAQQAAARFCPEASTVAVEGFGAVAAAVSAGAWGVVPCENRTAGPVADAILAVAQVPVRIAADLWLPVPHTLLAQPGVALGELTEVASHPQALAQCRAFLASRRLKPIAALTTTTAAAAVAREGPRHRGAIAPAAAATLYGLHIVATHIATDPANATRFWLIVPDGTPAWRGSRWTTTVATWLDEPAPPGARVLLPGGAGQPTVLEFSTRKDTLPAIAGPIKSLGSYPRCAG